MHRELAGRLRTLRWILRRIARSASFASVSLLVGFWSIASCQPSEPEPQSGGPETENSANPNERADSARKGKALLLEVKGAISPATMDYLLRGFKEARERESSLIIIRMDTPGGLSSSMREIIKEILNSPIPVVTYVSPPGARAASAGTYMLYASHVAAMAPSTNLGSATPVQMGGMPGSPEEKEDSPGGESEPRSGQESGPGGEAGEGKGDEPRRGSTAMERKVLEDAVAYIRGLAERHGRNADWAEKAVRDAVNITASDALEQNVIDIVAEDTSELLAGIHGRTVQMAHGNRTLATKGIRIEEFMPDWRHELLSVIADPSVAYFLMLIGFYGLLFELSNPGAIYPGVIGAISLLLALFAFQVLPINYAGLALMVLGLGLILAEAFVAGFGILGIGGIVAFVAGSVILMDEENLSVSLPLIGSVALVAAGFLAWVLTRLVALRRSKSVSGKEHLIGRIVEASSDFQGKGRLRVGGEIWWAQCEEPVKKGERLEIEAVDGLTLTVSKKE